MRSYNSIMDKLWQHLLVVSAMLNLLFLTTVTHNYHKYNPNKTSLIYLLCNRSVWFNSVVWNEACARKTAEWRKQSCVSVHKQQQSQWWWESKLNWGTFIRPPPFSFSNEMFPVCYQAKWQTFTQLSHGNQSSRVPLKKKWISQWISPVEVKDRVMNISTCKSSFRGITKGVWWHTVIFIWASSLPGKLDSSRLICLKFLFDFLWKYFYYEACLLNLHSKAPEINPFCTKSL